jgi:hypothetical protein
MTENTTTTTDAKATEKAPKAKDFTSYKEKAPTNLHRHYAMWLQEKTGITFPADVDVSKVVQLAVSLYHDYQASDENKARREQEAAERVANAKPGQTPEQLEAKIAKLKAQLEAAKATPANGTQSATATGQASTKPVGRRTAAKK